MFQGSGSFFSDLFVGLLGTFYWHLHIAILPVSLLLFGPCLATSLIRAPLIVFALTSRNRIVIILCWGLGVEVV